MKFIDATKQFVDVFYVFGHCSCRFKALLCCDDKHNKSRSVFSFVKRITPLILWNVIGGSVCGLTILLSQNDGRLGQSTKILILLLTTCQILRIISVFYQCVFHTDSLRDIVKLLQSIEFLYRNHLGSTLPYRQFQRNFRIKVVFLLVFFSQNFILFSMEHLHLNFVKNIGFLLRFSDICSVVSFFHIILYTDLLQFNLHHLNTIISRDTQQYTRNSTSIFTLAKQRYEKKVYKNLRKYKLIHYRLWEVTQAINAYFGWSMVSVILQSFINIVFCWYWEVKVISLDFGIESFGMFSSNCTLTLRSEKL